MTIATVFVTSKESESFGDGKVALMETSTLLKAVQFSAVHSGQLKLTAEKLVPLPAPRTDT